MSNDTLLNEYRAELDGIDAEMAVLFEKRMTTVKNIAEYKKQNGIPVTDTKRENEMLNKNLQYVSEENRAYYRDFLKSVTGISKHRQHNGNGALTVNGTPVYIERGASVKLAQYININRRAFVVTDSGVPEQYAKTVAAQFDSSFIFTLESGEKSKNTDTYLAIIKSLVDNKFTRSDVIVAVGGGVACDIAGFAAATFMRGIAFVNIPTTLLSQVDSSIGGKNGVDFETYKNQIGTFYRPEAIITDPALLSTLSPRQKACGMAECIKIALTSDAELFGKLENGNIGIDDIIRRCISIKIQVVEADEKENGVRKMLNFGHTLGHAIESMQGENGLLHGECVALGMLPMCSKEIRARVKSVLEKYNLPTSIRVEDGISVALYHDKKLAGNCVCTVRVDRVGEYVFRNSDVHEISDLFTEVYGL